MNQYGRFDEAMYYSPTGERWLDMKKLKLIPCVPSRDAKILSIGYGRVQAHIFDALEAAGGVEFIDETEFGWDYRLWFGWPRAWMLGNGPKRDAIIHTMFESEQQPRGWVNVLNRFKLVWTPSQWCKTLFVDWGVKTPIMVSGYGADPIEFPYKKRSLDEPFTFLALGHDVEGRKGVEQVMRCFALLQHQGELKDAYLLVKTQKGLVKSLTVPDGINIEFIYGTMSQDEYARLLHYAHVLVYPQVGEGFGLIPIEFMCTGGAVAVTAYSGVLEYLRDEYSYLLPKAVSDQALSDWLVWAYRNRDHVLATAERGAEYVHNEWTWTLAGLRARKLLYEHLGR